MTAERVHALVAGGIAVLILLGTTAGTADFLPQVYGSEELSIRAAVSDMPSRLTRIGSRMELHIAVSYDPERIAPEEPDADFFRRAWSEKSGAYLIDTEIRSEAGNWYAVFQFQILSCPDGASSCPGTRSYTVPQFTLEYSAADSAEGGFRTLRFRPAPGELIATSSIALTDERQLHPFEYYFPTGGYPELREATNAVNTSLAVAGAGFLAFLGGILMWPFRSHKNAPSSAYTASRWRRLWQDLRHESITEEAQFFDRLRRCVIWYCADELGRDAFEWLHVTDGKPKNDADGNDDDLRRFFVDLLHNPSGQGEALRDRFGELVSERPDGA